MDQPVDEAKMEYAVNGVTNLQQKLQELIDIHQRSQSLIAEREKCEEEIKKFCGFVKDLQANLETEMKKVEDLEKKLTENRESFKQQEEALTKQLADLRVERQQLRERMDDLERQPWRNREEAQKLDQQLIAENTEVARESVRIEQMQKKATAHVTIMETKRNQSKAKDRDIQDLQERLTEKTTESDKNRADLTAFQDHIAVTGPFAREETVVLLPQRCLHGSAPAGAVHYELYARNAEHYYYFLSDESLEAARANHADAINNGLALIGTIQAIQPPVNAAEDNPYGLPVNTPYRICTCNIP